eukprot:363181-Chlamydomonas_euryale.AAC.7
MAVRRQLLPRGLMLIGLHGNHEPSLPQAGLAENIVDTEGILYASALSTALSTKGYSKQE